MKHIISTLILATASTASVAAQAPVADTIADITDAKRIVITESPTGINVSVSRKAAGPDSLEVVIDRTLDNAVVKQQRWNSPFRAGNISGGSSRWDLCVGGPGLGWIDAVGQPDGLGIEMGKSLEISWVNMLAVKYRFSRWSTISLGFGFDWRNYRISTSGSRFMPTPDGTVGIGTYPDNVVARGSRLKVFSMGIPLLYTQSLPLRWIDGSYFSVTVGAVFNYSPHASLLARWELPDGTDVEQKSNHIGHRRFSFDLMGMVKLGWGISAYVRYSPQTVLRGPSQPKFRPLSTGLIFMY